MESRPRYKFYLDGVLLVTEPKGWDDIRYFIKYDRELNGLLIFIDATFNFYDDGYTILNSKLYSEGFCSESIMKIMESCADGTYRKAYEGIIKLSKIEINERLCQVTAKPDDNSYYAKIDKARKQKALPFVGVSKNNVEITPATISKGSFFNPQDGTYYPIQAGPGQHFSCSVISIYELFKFLIAFMTDGEVEFDSAYFGSGGEGEGLVITTGLVLFTVQTGLDESPFKDEFPEISFDEAFEEVYKQKDIGFYMDYSGAKPKMFIEPEQDIPNGVDIVTFDAVYEIKTRIAEDRLYNIIKLGSTETLDVLSLAFPESIDALGFKEEQYNTLGDCAIDKELDLVNDWIIASNEIEDAIVTPSDAKADKIFLISTTLNAGIYVANQVNNLFPPGPPVYYNQDLTNFEKLDNFFGAIPISIAKYLGTGDDTFRARRDPFNTGLISNVLAPLVSNEPVQFNDDFTPPNHDANNHYGNGTTQGLQVSQANSRFTAFASGVYTFRITIDQLVANAGAGITVIIKRYDSADVLLNFVNEQRFYPIADVYDNESFDLTLFMNATDYAQVDITYGNFLGVEDFEHGLTLELISAPGSAISKTFDPKNYLGLLHEFEYPIKKSQADLIRLNPRGNIVFAQANQNFRSARIDTITFNPDGVSNVRLITTINNSQ